MGERSSDGSVTKKVRRLRSLKVLYTSTPWMFIVLRSVSAEITGLQSVIENLQTTIELLGALMVAIALAYFAIGVIFKYLPWGSHKTKDTGGLMLDYAFIMIAIASVGGYMLLFAGDVAVAIVGQGEAPKFSGPWKLS